MVLDRLLMVYPGSATDFMIQSHQLPQPFQLLTSHALSLLFLVLDSLQSNTEFDSVLFPSFYL